MGLLARSLRLLPKFLFRLRNLATIKDISSERFQSLFEQLAKQGWRPSSRYEGFDAGIDYDRLHLRKGFRTMKCEWDNWSEWSIEGPRQVVEEIAHQSGLPVTYAWRWSEHDESPRNA
jgi:hypothetical protein